MADEKHVPEQLDDEALDQAQGGGFAVSRTGLTVKTATPASGLAGYDESGPGICSGTAPKTVERSDLEGLDGMHIDPVIP